MFRKRSQPFARFFRHDSTGGSLAWKAAGLDTEAD
jgi:hypothetical protein